METGVDPVEKLVLPVHEIVSRFGILVADHANKPLFAFFWDGVSVLVLVFVFLVFTFTLTLTLTLVSIFMLVLAITLILVLIFGVVG